MPTAPRSWRKALEAGVGTYLYCDKHRGMAEMKKIGWAWRVIHEEWHRVIQYRCPCGARVDLRARSMPEPKSEQFHSGRTWPHRRNA